MEKLSINPIDKNELPKTEQSVEYFSLTEQERNIQEVFKLSPELQNIGTVEKYQEYLKTIFPESKIKDIVWHGTDSKNISDILTNNFAVDQTEKGLSIKNAVFFAREYNAYGNDAYNSNDKTLIPALVNVHKIQLQENLMTITDINSLYKDNADALLQISFDVNSYKNGEKLSFEELENIRIKLEENGLQEIIKNTTLEKLEVIKILEDETEHDSFLESYINKFGIENIPFGQLSVKPEQVHILGSKSDIEKFKEFVSKNEANIV